jgi:hypothetical protein
MDNFVTSKKAARLIVLQRIELISPFFKKLRKLFGRYIFSNFITKYFLNSKLIGKKYYKVMLDEFLSIKKFISVEDKFFLSIGGGMGGLELILNQSFNNKDYYFIERNYVSKKIKYGWGGKINNEAYNDLSIQSYFLETNGMQKSQINIFDYDKNELPIKKFDVIISLLSLDYHYDFDLYADYLKKVSNPSTKIIFDTIRADYFIKFFKNVKVINSQNNTTHKSKRVLCSEFLN